MATYTPIEYTSYNPREEILPYIVLFDKARLSKEEQVEKYLDWLSSSSELLKNDEDYKDARLRYELDITKAAEAVYRGDLNTANSIDVRKDYRRLNEGLKKAEALSEAIKFQNQHGDKYAFSKRYTHNTPLREVDPATIWDYNTVDLSEYSKIGLLIGKNLSATSKPLEVGRMLLNAMVLIKQGRTQDEVLQALSNDNSELSNTIEQIKDRAIQLGITDPNEQTKVNNAILNGILGSVSSAVSMQSNPDYSYAMQGLLYNRAKLQADMLDAERAFQQTGDLSEAVKAGHTVRIIRDKNGLAKSLLIDNQIYDGVELTNDDKTNHIKVRSWGTGVRNIGTSRGDSNPLVLNFNTASASLKEALNQALPGNHPILPDGLNFLNGAYKVDISKNLIAHVDSNGVALLIPKDNITSDDELKKIMAVLIKAGAITNRNNAYLGMRNYLGTVINDKNRMMNMYDIVSKSTLQPSSTPNGEGTSPTQPAVRRDTLEDWLSIPPDSNSIGGSGNDDPTKFVRK